MKKIVLFLLSIPFVYSCTGDAGSFRNMDAVTKRITYTVPVANTSYPPFQYVEAEKRYEMATLLFNAIESGKIKAYSDEDGRDEISVEAFKYSLQRTFSTNVFAEDGSIIDVKTDSLSILPKDITEIGFLEEWYINPKTMEFGKKVNGLALLYDDFSIDNLGVEAPEAQECFYAGYCLLNDFSQWSFG